MVAEVHHSHWADQPRADQPRAQQESMSVFPSAGQAWAPEQMFAMTSWEERPGPRVGCCVQVLHSPLQPELWPVLCTYLVDEGRSPGPGETSSLPFQTGNSPGPRIRLNVIL